MGAKTGGSAVNLPLQSYHPAEDCGKYQLAQDYGIKSESH